MSSCHPTLLLAPHISLALRLTARGRTAAVCMWIAGVALLGVFGHGPDAGLALAVLAVSARRLRIADAPAPSSSDPLRRPPRRR